LPCNLIPTLETFDTNTERTDLISGVSHFVWVPPPLATPARHHPVNARLPRGRTIDLPTTAL